MERKKKTSQMFWWCELGHYTNFQGVCPRHLRLNLLKKDSEWIPPQVAYAYVIYPNYPILLRTLKKTVGYNYRMYKKFPKYLR